MAGSSGTTRILKRDKRCPVNAAARFSRRAAPRVATTVAVLLAFWGFWELYRYVWVQTGWTWCDSTRGVGGNLRDPFVMPDPDLPGGWLMYYVALRDTVTSASPSGHSTWTAS